VVLFLPLDLVEWGWQWALHVPCAAYAKADAKLFEAIFESMLQLYLQMIVLLFYADDEGTGGSPCLPSEPLYLTIAIGVASNTLGLVTKFVHVIGFDGNTRVTFASVVYFAADATTRAIAVAMVYGWIGGGGIAAVGGGLLVLDLVLQQLQRRSEWKDVEHGSCGGAGGRRGKWVG
jgi:hypothetical protein